MDIGESDSNVVASLHNKFLFNVSGQPRSEINRLPRATDCLSSGSASNVELLCEITALWSWSGLRYSAKIVYE